MIQDYDFDKDGNLNMAEFKQYLTESEEGAEKVEEEEKQEEQEMKWCLSRCNTLSFYYGNHYILNFCSCR